MVPIEATELISRAPSNDAANPLSAPGKHTPGSGDPSAKLARIRMAVDISDSLCLSQTTQLQLRPNIFVHQDSFFA